MRVYKAGLVSLSAGNVYAVSGALYNVQEQIRISLLGRSEGTVALNVGHSAVNCEVLILHAGQELEEVLVVLGAASLVGLERSRINGVCRVHADTALEAGCGLLTEQTLHFYFLYQIFRTLMNMSETIDLFSGKI